LYATLPSEHFCGIKIEALMVGFDADLGMKKESAIHVLVVDGQVVQRTVLKRSLHSISAEITVTTTPNAKLALSHLQRRPAQVLITGLGLPEDETEELQRKVLEAFPTTVILDEVDLSGSGGQSVKNVSDQKALEHQYREVLTPHLNILFARLATKSVVPAKDLPFLREACVRKLATKQGRARCPKNPRLLLIGVSTGGPNALRDVLPLLNATIRCPIVVIQHISDHFCEILVKRMDQLCSLSVLSGQKGCELRPGTVYFAPGDRHSILKRNKDGVVVFDSVKETRVDVPKPSVDIFLKSLMEIGFHRIVTVILTGMGSDGLRGVRLLRPKGAYCIAQDEASSLVWSMPRHVIEAGESDEVLSLDRIAEQLNRMLS